MLAVINLDHELSRLHRRSSALELQHTSIGPLPLHTEKTFEKLRRRHPLKPSRIARHEINELFVREVVTVGSDVKVHADYFHGEVLVDALFWAYGVSTTRALEIDSEIKILLRQVDLSHIERVPPLQCGRDVVVIIPNNANHKNKEVGEEADIGYRRTKAANGCFVLRFVLIGDGDIVAVGVKGLEVPAESLPSGGIFLHLGSISRVCIGTRRVDT